MKEVQGAREITGKKDQRKLELLTPAFAFGLPIFIRGTKG